MTRRRLSAKRHCARKRDARRARAALRKAILERAQGVAPKVTELNSGFLLLPPPRRGAPGNNRNALKQGVPTRARRALFAELKAQIVEGRALLDAFNSGPSPGLAKCDLGDPLLPRNHACSREHAGQQLDGIKCAWETT